MDRYDLQSGDGHDRPQHASEALATAGYTGREGFSAPLMAALSRVPRHRFVPASQAAHAYINSALAIGHGQTISQPYIVALMTDVLDLEPDAVVLEIGTGSGYQTAVLVELAGYVYLLHRADPRTGDRGGRAADPIGLPQRRGADR